MSSTTSSDCESCNCSQCTYSFDNNNNGYGKLVTNSRHVPIYATMAHPLIYYAEIQPSNRRQTNDQPRKDNPFKKAFKWYTQERGRVTSNKTNDCPERSGFASWLDNKYDEYLRESGPPTKAPQTMTHESRTPKNTNAEPETCPGASKRFGRLKSPWRKRRRSVNDGGDVPEKGLCVSCEYILKPKDLTRATSDHTPTSGGKSNATVVSSNMPCNPKCSGKSYSLSDVGHERSVPRHGDTMTHISQGPRPQEQETARKPAVSCMCYQERVVQVPSKYQDSVHCKCPNCMCPPEKIPEVVKVQPKQQVQPCCTCSREKVPKVEKMPSKLQSKTQNSPIPSQEKMSEVVRTPSIKEGPTTAPCCLCPLDKEPHPCPLDKEPQVEQPPSQTQYPTYSPLPPQENLTEVVKVPSKAKDPPNQPMQEQEKDPQITKLPSKLQEPTEQPGPCCKCNLEKVPEVVQVPSQSRAVQESCQVPEDKEVPVNEGTQYESAIKPRSTQNIQPCCCNTCNPSFPQPVSLCLPFKVQSSKISSLEPCLITPSAICEAQKKQKKVTQRRSISCQFDEGNKSKVDSQCQHQNEPCLCSKPCCSNCHSVNQVYDPISIQRQSYSTVAISEEAGECTIVKEVAVVNKFTRSVTCASNDAAQTSDHSICFDKDVVSSCQCPLLLKIIYAGIKE